MEYLPLYFLAAKILVQDNFLSHQNYSNSLLNWSPGLLYGFWIATWLGSSQLPIHPAPINIIPIAQPLTMPTSSRLDPPLFIAAFLIQVLTQMPPLQRPTLTLR